jgi:hypothetical protein
MPLSDKANTFKKYQEPEKTQQFYPPELSSAFILFIYSSGDTGACIQGGPHAYSAGTLSFSHSTSPFLCVLVIFKTGF